MGNSFKLYVTLIWIMIFVGCGGNYNGDVSPTTVQQQPAAGQLSLPAPIDALSLVPDRTSSALFLERNGCDYVPGLAQRIINAEPSARFSPTWTGGSTGFVSLSYAIYNFDVQTYFGMEVVTSEWSEAPLDYGNLWIGLSNWSGNNWDWYAGSPDGTLDLQTEGYSEYTKAGTGEMLVAVVLLGTGQALLDKLSVGEPPIDDWWMRGHDRLHTGRSPFIGAQTNNVKWTFTAASNVDSSPTIGPDGTIYVGSKDFKLYAINPDGTEKWSYSTEGMVGSSPAIAADGTVYVGSYNDSKLNAINPDGTLKWSYPLGAPIYISSPAIGTDGTVYVGCQDGKLYAVNPNGNLKWSFEGEPYVDSSPAIGVDGTVYFGCDDDKLYALNPNGSLKWAFTATGEGMKDIDSSPAVGADGTVYVGSYDDNLYAINQDGSLKWSFLTLAVVNSSPAIGVDGTVYVGSSDNNLYAINSDGSLKWFYPTMGSVQSSPAIGADGTVYVGSRDTNIYAINADGSLKWSYTTGESSWGVASSPAIGADGTVYVGSGDGKLYAFQDAP